MRVPSFAGFYRPTSIFLAHPTSIFFSALHDCVSVSGHGRVHVPRRAGDDPGDVGGNVLGVLVGWVVATVAVILLVACFASRETKVERTRREVVEKQNELIRIGLERNNP